MSDADSVAAIFARHLGGYIGQHTAPMAIKTFAKQALGVTPDQVKRLDAGKLLDAMRPMLNTLLGKEHAEAVAKLIRADVGI
ncbi:MAG TPA: hypothetical protein VF698_03165 [Thermoanaerobaculia bacterium]|jgi:hypothetical protein